MIKVECVSCKAPYELDERRIPDKGMRMRCPKCGTSFNVSKQGATTAAPAAGSGTASPAIGAPPAAASAAGAGAGKPIAPAFGAAPTGTLVGGARPGATPATGTAGAPKYKTALGVAPPQAMPARDKPPPAGSLAPPPMSGMAAAAAAVVRSSVPPPAPSAGSRAAAAKGAFGATMMGTAPAAPKPAAKPGAQAPSFGVDMPDDLPPPKPPIEASDLSVSRIYVEDLPAPKREVDLPAPRASVPKPSAHIDLPAPKPAAGAKPWAPIKAPIALAPTPAAKPSSSEIDLPAAKPRAARPFGAPPAAFGEIDLPVAKPPGGSAAMSPPSAFGEVDLPAAKPIAPKPLMAPPPAFGEVDLPAAKPAAAPRGPLAPAFNPAADKARAGGALPLPAAPAPQARKPVAPAADDFDLPARKIGGGGGGGFGDLDLPAPKGFGADLPAPRGQGADLPAPKGYGADLPATKGGGFADLPATKGFGADLPATKGFGADLPAPKLGGGFGDLDLPTPKGIADLPTPKNLADLPTPKNIADLPTPKNIADLPVARGGADLPTPRGYGESSVDLPAPRNDLPVPKGDESSFADLDLDLPDLPGEDEPDASRAFGDIELPPPKVTSNLAGKGRTVQSHGAPSARGAGGRREESSFGDLTLDEEHGDSDLPPSLLGDEESSFDELNLEEDRPSGPVPGPPPRRGAAPPLDDVEELDPGAEDLEDDPFDSPPRRDSRVSNDEEEDDFGEAEFDEGEEGDAEETEFGISGDEARGLGLPPEILRKQRGEEFEAKQAALGRRAVTILVRVAILLVLLIGGGAALTFTDYGVFGIYYWERWLPAAGDARFASEAISKAEKLASTDRYVDVKRALKELGQARNKAGINRDLLTRSLAHEALYMVRFGDDPGSSSRAAAIWKRLEERAFKAPGIELARASDAARRKQWRDVGSHLNAARSKAPSDPYVELLAGEIAMTDGKLEQADKAFTRALQLGGGARAQWGVARVALAGTDLEAQVAAVNETLKLSPMHVEARIAEARIVWMQGKEERAVHLLRVALGLEPTEEDQYLWSSKQGTSLGYSLLGYVHESRGRLHTARESYDQALSADPYRVEALLGSGRVLLREQRASDALARFESALSSATKGGENPQQLSGRKADAEARLGMSRALIALDRGPAAKSKLEELTKTLPNDPDVVLAMGETEASLGNAEQAEDHFRKSIELAPKRFDGYLSLSQLFFKQGDAAKASEVLNEAAEQVEETSEMRRMLGQSELARNKIDSAVHEFSRALELDPHSVDAMFGMAMALRKRGELDGADKMLEQIAVRDPAYAGLAEQRGLLFEAKGEFDKAIKAYSNALEKDPGDTGLLLRLGAAQVEATQFDAAEQTLDKVVRELPNSAEAAYFIGRIAFGRGRTPDALTHFDRAVGLDGTKAEYRLYVSRASLDMGNLGRALEEAQAAIGIDSGVGDAYWVRAVVRLRMGAVKDALKDLEKALKLNPARAEALAVMGDCYEQLRELGEAIRSYKQALERSPQRGEWWYRLSVLHADAGDRGASDAAVRQALELGEKVDPIPYWLPDAYRIAGESSEARGNRNDAIRFFKRYLEIAQPAAIDRVEIEKQLKKWGVQLNADE